MKYAPKDKKWVIIYAIITILGFLLYLIMNISAEFVGIFDTREFFTFSLNPINFYTTGVFAGWFGILGLLYYNLKGLFYNYRKKIKATFFLISSIITACYAVLYYPLYFFHFTILVWTMINFLGIILIFIYLMQVMGKDEI